jgi:hypothetical protein
VVEVVKKGTKTQRHKDTKTHRHIGTEAGLTSTNVLIYRKIQNDKLAQGGSGFVRLYTDSDSNLSWLFSGEIGMAGETGSSINPLG